MPAPNHRERQLMQNPRGRGWVKAIELPEAPGILKRLLERRWIEGIWSNGSPLKEWQQRSLLCVCSALGELDVVTQSEHRKIGLGKQSMSWDKRKTDRVHFQHAHRVNLMAVDGTWRRSCVLRDISASDARFEIDGSRDVLQARQFFWFFRPRALRVGLDKLINGGRSLSSKQKKESCNPLIVGKCLSQRELNDFNLANLLTDNFVSGRSILVTAQSYRSSVSQTEWLCPLSVGWRGATSAGGTVDIAGCPRGVALA
jgi:hypothetical protein